MAHNEICVATNYHEGEFGQLPILIYFGDVMRDLGGLDLDYEG